MRLLTKNRGFLPATSDAVVSASLKPAVYDMASLGSIDDSTILDHKSLESLARLLGKERVDILFIGHYNAGRSTLEKHILEVTWAADRDTAELEGEMTTSNKTKRFETDNRRYTIMREPGPKNYKPDRIQDADVAVLIVSAIESEFEEGCQTNGQTQSHAIIARDMGINKLIVAVNKMDDSTVGWSKERYDKIVTELSSFLKDNRYDVENDVIFVPISENTHVNIKVRVDPGTCDWYTGVSLLDCLDSIHLRGRKLNAPFRFPIRRIDKDMGIVVEGKIVTGFVKKGMHVLVMPNAEAATIDTILNEIGDEVQLAGAGDTIRLLIPGIARMASEFPAKLNIMPGVVLCHPKNPVPVVSRFKAEIRIVDSKCIICEGLKAVLHIHAAVVEITLSMILHRVDESTGRTSKKPPLFLKMGQHGIVVIETERLICAETFAKSPRMGLFSIKDEGKTVAVGRVKSLLCVEQK
ncbi:translation termination factor GTPase eRF3 [Mortierella sp. AM989]|nr:translation termination factor GTPase eRF3 [Mortierella sp. AM989]